MQRYKARKDYAICVVEAELTLSPRSHSTQAMKGGCKGQHDNNLLLLPVSLHSRLLHMHSCSLLLNISCAAGSSPTNTMLTACVAAVLLEQCQKCLKGIDVERMCTWGVQEQVKGHRTACGPSHTPSQSPSWPIPGPGLDCREGPAQSLTAMSGPCTLPY